MEKKTLLLQAVRELLFNVVKHAGVDEARVELSAGDTRVKITVSDAGRGFDENRTELLPADDGGFGIFSIRERMDLLGGSLKIESLPGKGTRAVLEAPLEPDAGARHEKEKSGRVKKSAAGIDAEGKPARKIKVLLVDDHDLFRTGLRNLLEQQGVDIVYAVGGGTGAGVVGRVAGCLVRRQHHALARLVLAPVGVARHRRAPHPQFPPRHGTWSRGGFRTEPVTGREKLQARTPSGDGHGGGRPALVELPDGRGVLIRRAAGGGGGGGRRAGRAPPPPSSPGGSPRMLPSAIPTPFPTSRRSRTPSSGR
jgi:hypothetical protein